MGRKLDLSGLTDVEAEHVMQVVERDMQLRKAEETRLYEMKKALVEEGSRSVLLSRQHRFNERCCIRCCSPFTFLLNPKRSCLDCCYNICKSCCTYSKKDKGWLCSSCQKTRLLKTQSLEWFYNNVRRRFKRFGSAKVLKNLYRGHATERGALAEFTEGSTYEESICNESSVYESDCTFYRQSEEHSMAETISVALRVAEEAIDEAIAKAESQGDSQEKHNEAQYLRDNRGELIEELATTIVHKIVRRKQDLSEMQSGDVDQNSDMISPDQTQSAFEASLWRSRSAFCLLTDQNEKTDQHTNSGSRHSPSRSHALEMTETMPIQAMPSWRSVDRLDNSMLQSPDGNWIAYQSNLLSRPSLLTKRKSLVYSVLERESGVVSAYDEMGSETEPEANGVWGAALVELRRKMSASKQLTYPESYSRQATLPLNEQAQYFTENSIDTENSSGPDGPLPKSQKTLLPFLKRKGPVEHRRLSTARRPIMDVNFNPEGADSSEDGLEDSRVKRSRRRRKNKREDTEWKGLSGLSLAEPDSCTQLSDALAKRRYMKHDSVDTSDTATPDILSSGATTPDPFGPDLNAHGFHGVAGSLDQELTSKLKELTSQIRETQLSSTEDELDRMEFRMWNEEDDAKLKVGDKVMGDAFVKTTKEISDETESTNQGRSTEMLREDDLTARLRKLTSQVRETQLSSTEDELDRFEYQTNAKSINQPVRKEILEVDDWTDVDKSKTHQNKLQSPNVGEGQQSRAESTELGETLSCELALNRFTSEDGKMEFDRIMDTVVKALGDMEEHTDAYSSEGVFLDRAGSEAEKLEMMEEGENVTEQKTGDKATFEVGFVSGKEREEQNKEINEEGKIHDVLTLKSSTGDTEETEDKQCIKLSEERVQEKDGNSQSEEKEEQKDPTAQHSTPTVREYLTPDEIYKDAHLLDIEKNLRFISNILQQKYSAASLRGITTEVLKVLNATEDLIHGSIDDEQTQAEHSDLSSIPPAEARRLDEQLSRLEENVYVAAGTVFGLEAELGDLEECARGISGSSTERELAHLEDQVASAAAQVQQAELQVLDISSRIAALKNAGLNVTPQTKFAKLKTEKNKTQTISSSRKLRRRLPAPPKQDKDA